MEIFVDKMLMIVHRTVSHPLCVGRLSSLERLIGGRAWKHFHFSLIGDNRHGFLLY